MPQRTLTYPKLPRNTVKRKSYRATYDLPAIQALINSTTVLHVSFPPSPTDGPFPAILPLIGVMGSFENPSAGLDEPMDCYLHGYVSSRIMNLAVAASPGQGEEKEEQGMPVSICATKVDGLILSLTPNSHSMNYRSAVLHGFAVPVTDAEEKVYAMQLITNKVLPDRWEHTRVPPDKAEMDSTRILRVRIVDGSGKVREGGPGDEKKDTEREDIRDKVWCGVVPMWEEYGEPIAWAGNKMNEVPEHVRKEAEEGNRRRKEFAAASARKEMKGPLTKG